MRLSRTNLVPVLAIVAGWVIGASFSFGFLVTQVRAQEPLEFKLLLPVAELESALSRIDRQIVLALGSDSVRALGRDVENLIFHNLRPFTSLLRSGDVEGAYLVATEDVELTTLFLGLPEVQRALPTDVSLHWEAGLVDLGRIPYRRLYVTAREAFATGETLEDMPTTQPFGDFIAVVRDGEVIATSRNMGGVSR